MLERAHAMRWLIPACVSALGLTSPVCAQTPATANFTSPTLDRWNYPFNSTPGVRDRGSTFSAGADNNFDDRDGQVLLGFDTLGLIPEGLGEARYRLVSATLRIATFNGGFAYDPTYDSFKTYLDPLDPDFLADADAGRPVELYGVSFRGECSPGVLCDEATYVENAPWGAGGGTTFRSVRHAFPVDFQAGSTLDISNNVDDRFDPVPFAVGQVAGLAPGSLVPFDSDFVFTLDAGSPDVQAYVARALNLGRLRLMLSSLHPAVQQGGEFADFYMKENLFGAGFAARLDLTVDILPPPLASDIDGDGVVGPGDLLALLAAWGRDCTASPCPEDIDGDGMVGPGDLLALLADWGRTAAP